MSCYGHFTLKSYITIHDLYELLTEADPQYIGDGLELKIPETDIYFTMYQHKQNPDWSLGAYKEEHVLCIKQFLTKYEITDFY